MLTRKEFDDLQQKIFVAKHQGKSDVAIALIDRAIKDGDVEMKGISLLYRSMILLEQGAGLEAKKSCLVGLSNSQAGTFLRYGLEHHAGMACEQLGEISDAVAWYRSALKTCADGAEFSGDEALKAFAGLADNQIAIEDRALVASVLTKSWRVLELPGFPNLDDSQIGIAALLDGFAALQRRLTEGDF